MNEAMKQPVFEQGLDATRPHTLLTEAARWTGQLEYRYDDTGERVLVPNIWYNQTYQSRVSHIRSEADRQDDFARRIQANTPLHMTTSAAANIASRYRQRANKMRAEASRMEASGRDTHPVAASLMDIDYGEVVTL